MKILAVVVCLLALLTSNVAAGETEETITKLSQEQMTTLRGDLPESGIVTGGQPNEATLRKFAEAGYGAVIDMRANDEDRGFDEPKFVESLGMTYVALPIAGADDVSFDKAAELDKILAEFDGPVLVHCASGNRVGALFALRAKNLGASSEDALMIGQAAGVTRLEGLVKERLELK